ncbi:MAG: hypothetical protein ABIT83_15025, partial [Massilia sp.]
MKNAFAIVTLAGLLSACAVAPPSVPTAPAASPGSLAAVEPMVVDEVPESEESAALDEQLPKVALSSELMFSLLKAELDIARGDWRPAYEALFAAAGQTRDPRLAQRAADVALANEQSGDAMRAVSLWRELAPESDAASQYFLGLVTLSDDIAPAEAIFQRRLAEAPGAARALLMFQTQQLLSKARDKAAVSAMLARLLQPYAQSPEAHLLLAQNAFANGASAEAQKEAQTALALQGDSEVAVLTLAQVLQDDAKAGAVLAKFIAEHPQARDVRAARARL